MTPKNIQSVDCKDFWIISNSKYTHIEIKDLPMEIRPGRVKEYTISEFGRYLLNPKPIQIQKKLVGCEVHYHQRSSKKTKHKIWQILPGSFGKSKDKNTHPEVLMPQSETKMPIMSDGDLESHLNKLYGLLRPYDPIFKGLSNLDRSKISDIIGICEDFGGNRSWLHLRGDISEKINYIGSFIIRPVNVILEKSYIADGLFELRGFDFKSFDPKKTHRLIKFFHEGKQKACLIKKNNKVEFWVEDISLLNYLHLLKQSIDTNPNLMDSFSQCMKKDAQPLKLLFNRNLSIEYSKSNFPKIYEEALKVFKVDDAEKESIMKSLQQMQFGISLSYLPHCSPEEEVLCTNLSVMHDFRALEQLKENLPTLYSEISKKASVSEAGKYYLLDTIEGCQNVE